MLRCQIIYYAFKISGRVRYKFASFWNRNNALRGLQKAVKNYHAIVEAEKKVSLLLVLHVIFLVIYIHCAPLVSIILKILSIIFYGYNSVFEYYFDHVSYML